MLGNQEPENDKQVERECVGNLKVCYVMKIYRNAFRATAQFPGEIGKQLLMAF